MHQQFNFRRKQLSIQFHLLNSLNNVLFLCMFVHIYWFCLSDHDSETVFLCKRVQTFLGRDELRSTALCLIWYVIFDIAIHPILLFRNYIIENRRFLVSETGCEDSRTDVSKLLLYLIPDCIPMSFCFECITMSLQRVYQEWTRSSNIIKYYLRNNNVFFLSK